MCAFSIGQASKETGVHVETIRYYERIALMPEPMRSDRGTRRYNQQSLRRLGFIKKSRDLGFSIEEIKGLLILVDENNVSCGEVHALASDHRQAVLSKISDLERLAASLGAMIEKCSQGKTPDCPIIDDLMQTV